MGRFGPLIARYFFYYLYFAPLLLLLMVLAPRPGADGAKTIGSYDELEDPEVEVAFSREVGG